MKKLLLSFITFLAISANSQINPDDGCPTTAVLPVNSSCVVNNYTLPGSYTNGGLINSSSCTGGSNRDDGWYSFVATSTAIVIEETASRAHRITVYDACGGGTELGCDINNSANTNVVSLSGLTIGNTYYIQQHRRSGGGGASMSGTICVYEVTPPGPEDSPWPGMDLGTITCPGTTSVSDNTSGAFTDCGISSAGDHIYQFTTTEYSDLTISLCASSYDTQVHLYNLATGSCASTAWATNDDACGNQSRITSNCFGPGSWVVVVEGSGGSEGAYTLDITLANCSGCTPGPEDCGGGNTVCSDATFSGNSGGSGNVADLNASNRGCLNSNENEASWYYFSAATSGDFEFEIQTSVDYDFAVWGPMSSIVCPPVVAPIRCSYSGTLGNTGLLDGSGDLTEGAGGNKYVEDINAIAGEQYVILIDNFTSDGSTFDLVWNLSNGATLDCTPLPVEMTNFIGSAQIDHNLIEWETKTEIETKEFILERSFDGENFDIVTTIPGAGNSTQSLYYWARDYEIWTSVIYYRVKTVDLDESYEYSPTITVTRNDEVINIFPNPTNGEVTLDFLNDLHGDFNITFVDALGRTVTEEVVIDQNQYSYNSNLLLDAPEGMYIVNITDAQGNLVQQSKLIKN